MLGKNFASVKMTVPVGRIAHWAGQRNAQVMSTSSLTSRLVVGLGLLGIVRVAHAQDLATVRII